MTQHFIHSSYQVYINRALSPTMFLRLVGTNLSRRFPNKDRFLRAAFTSRKVTESSEFSRPVSLLLPLSAHGGASSNTWTTLGTMGMGVALLAAAISERNGYQHCVESQNAEAAVQPQSEIVDNAVSEVLSRLSPLLLSCKNTPYVLKARKVCQDAQVYALVYNSELGTAHRNVNTAQCCNIFYFVENCTSELQHPDLTFMTKKTWGRVMELWVLFDWHQV